MKKEMIEKVIALALLILLLICAYIIFAPSSRNPGLRAKGELVVNGSKVDDKNVIIYQHGSSYHATLPLLSVLDALGNSIRVESDDTIIITMKDETFFVSEYKLYTKDNLFVCDVPAYPDSFFDQNGTPGELYVEDTELILIFNHLGMKSVTIDIDPSKRTVFISV